ncbi:hypothetical protein PV04_02558 [Phialophora macrospora]|uniref:Heterokaryon incompatibility domain-containing protein n=1 Tax=Phialophora macrospora TaxID=1851006 RepID=A0A0D2FPM5_9EURO|nr:hypothetical protein PV04_02558 [Phialophora macrospora]
MDHLPTPHDPLPIPEFPIFGEAGYDHGSLQGYPVRCGFDPMLLERDEHELMFKGKSVAESAEFVQNWLYFGFLESVIGQPVDVACFITLNTDGHRFLTTASLPGLLHQWATTIRGLSASVRARRVSELGDIMIQIRSQHGTLCYWQHKTPSSERLPESLLLSVSILGTTLDYALSHLGLALAEGYETSDEFILQKSAGKWNTPRLEDYFEERGWCENGLRRLQSYVFATGYMYASRLKRAENLTHSNCSETRCVVNDILPGAPYHPRHTSQGCNCTPIGPPVEAIMEILDNRQFPVLELSMLGKVPVLRAVPYKPGMNFVAISHVWSDGLGNPYANTIPGCRASWFYHVLCQVYRFTPHEQEDAENSSLGTAPCERAYTVYFWLDTLCVPVGASFQKHRDLAIRWMAITYSEAQVVLVLDSELLRHRSRPASTLENLFRILCSAWMRRVWTLQEAVLSRGLLVLFKDDILDVDRAVRDLRRQTVGPDALDPVANEACRFYCQARVILYANRPVRFILAFSLMQARQTSVMDDEAICFANMIGVDASEILKTARGGIENYEASQKRQSKAMKVLFNLLDRVPEQLLWNPGPKLLEDGYRWAPSSFHGGSVLAPNHQSVRRDQNGLQITSLGLLLRGPWSDPDISSGCIYEAGEHKLHVELRHCDSWHQVSSFDRDGNHKMNLADCFDQDTQLAVIFNARNIDLRGEDTYLVNSPAAVLVSVRGRHGISLMCRYERRVRVRYATCCVNAWKGSLTLWPAPHTAQTEQDGISRTGSWTSLDQEWRIM